MFLAITVAILPWCMRAHDWMDWLAMLISLAWGQFPR
jgi:hypothetical protein